MVVGATIALTLTFTTTWIHNNYEAKQAYMKCLENIQVNVQADKSHWESVIQAAINSLHPMIETVGSLASDNLSSNPLCSENISEVGRCSLVPLDKQIIRFRATVNTSSVDERLNYLMMYFDLLSDMDSVLDLELSYKQGSITKREYLRGIDKCTYFNVALDSFNIEMKDIVIAKFAPEKFDAAGWVKDKGWGYSLP